MSDTVILDKNKLIKEGLIFFLAEEEALEKAWIDSIGTVYEKECLQKLQVKKDLIQQMMKRLIENF